MFRHFHRYFKKCRDRFETCPYIGSERGQVAVIIILVIAIALIFYAVSLNVGRFAETKTTVTIAANTGAAQLASFMASYGQYVSWDQLKGQYRICKKSGVFRAIVKAIVAIVLTIITAGVGWVLLFVVVLSLLTIAMQVAIVEPALTEMWNSQWMKFMGPADQYLERGIFAGLQKAVTDAGVVPDVNDADGDMVWGFDPATNEPLDEFGRFGLYYGERMKEITPVDDQHVIDFLCGLENFVYQGPSQEIVDADSTGNCTDTSPDWGLYDPYEYSCDRAECNPCCVPYQVQDLDGTWIDVRPDTCPNYTSDAFWRPSCLAGSPYRGGANNYPWVYDLFYENPYNNIPPAAPIFVSFREQIGRDDEHDEYYKPDQTTPPTWDPNAIPQLPETGPIGFYLRDATNYYVPPYFTPGIPENRKGIFPFFYQIADWKVNLDLAADPFDLVKRPNQCHWCDPRALMVGACPANQPAEIPQLILDAANPPSGAVFNTSFCVDGLDANVAGNPPLAVDKVKLPDPFDPGFRGAILAQDDQCAENPSDTDLTTGFWKRGGDRFCVADPSTQWPYSSGCAKHGPPGTCTETDPASGTTYNIDCDCEDFPAGDPTRFLWYDDALDELIYGIPVFLEWAEDLILQWRADPIFTATEFEVWYQGASEWIEPAGTGDLAADRAAGRCYVCNDTDGGLLVWRDKILEMKTRLEAWRDTSFEGAGCEEVWCVPPVQGAANGYGINECLDVTLAEFATFDANSNSIRGDMADVVACLDWNANDTVTYPLAGMAEFIACRDACAPCTSSCWGGGNGDEIYEACYDLPPSPYSPLYPDYDPSSLATIYDCLTSCQNSDCQAMNPIYFSSDPSLVDFEADPSLCQPGSAWFNEMDQNLGIPCRSTTVYEQNLELTISSGGTTATGNGEKFQACFDDCSDNGVLDVVEKCSDLPRSLVPGVDTRLPNQSDLARLQGCLNSCNNTNCQAMSPAYFTGNPATTDFQTNECPTWGSGNIWYDEIIAALSGVCNPAPGGWLDGIIRSEPEAQNQAVKFRKRQEFLNNRLRQLNDTIAILDEAYNQFEAFLTCNDGPDPGTDPDGPACKLIRDRINYQYKASGLPYEAIYAWQSEPPESRKGTPLEGVGYWHIVKVEGRIPRRCDTYCGVSWAQNSDPSWPWVDTYNKGFLKTTRCYEMASTDGVVKFRVTRFDEDRDTALLTFPNGVPLWDFRFFHPRRGAADPVDVTGLGATCANIMADDPAGLPAGVSNIYQGAFQLTKYRAGDLPCAGAFPCPVGCGDCSVSDTATYPDPLYNVDCWNTVTKILTRGVASESCAQYYWHGGMRSGMGFRFIPCQEF